MKDAGAYAVVARGLAELSLATVLAFWKSTWPIARLTMALVAFASGESTGGGVCVREVASLPGHSGQ